MIFYFSGTGNSEHVASHLAEQTQENMISIFDIWRKHEWTYTLHPGERVGFVFPVYAWGPPRLVMECLQKLTFQGEEHPYCYLVCTCGDDAGCTLSIFRKALQQKGWKLHSGFSVTMPNTYVCMPGFDVDSKSVICRKLEALPLRLSAITHIVVEKRPYFDVHPGKMPRLKSYVLRPLFNRFMITDKPFHTNDACNGCSLCAHICPMKNIQMKDKAPQWKGQCTGCLRCYHKCPHHAIEFGKQTKRKGQYYFRQAPI